MASKICNNTNSSIFMFPWLGHGHISPFLELAKKLANKNILIYFCSTPINLISIKDQVSHYNSTTNNTIQLVELHLPSLPNLPPHLHTCKGLPPHLNSTLTDALHTVRSDLSKIITDLNPDLAILDMDLPSNAYVSSSIADVNIPTALFSICTASNVSFALHMLTFHRVDDYPFPAIYMRDYQVKALLQLREKMPEEVREKRQHEDNDNATVPGRISFILVKSLRELDGKYVDYLSELTKKKVVPVGALIRDINLQDEEIKLEIIEWLDKKDKCSTVFINFGSEIVLSKEEITEIAHGLDISGVNFIWYLRFPKGEDDEPEVEDVLPEDFLGKVKERGRILKGWAPQGRILGHSSLGAFVTHCGWSSLLESINCGIPVIGLPMLHDQPFNAKLMEELGVGVEIVKDSDGKFERQQVAKVVKQVLVGQDYRNKARQLMEEVKLNAQSTIDGALQHVIEFIKNKNKNKN